MYRSNHRKRGTSAVSLVPKFTFVLIVHGPVHGGGGGEEGGGRGGRRGQMSQGRRSFLTGHPHLPHTHTLTLSSGTQDRTVWARTHRAAFIGSLSGWRSVRWSPNRRGGSRSAETACVCFSFFDFQGAKHLPIHTIEQPEYCHFKLHSSEKGGRGVGGVGVGPIIFTYIHTYPNNLKLFENEIQCNSLFYMHEFCCILLSNITPSSSVHLLYNGGTIWLSSYPAPQKVKVDNTSEASSSADWGSPLTHTHTHTHTQHTLTVSHTHRGMLHGKYRHKR